ncbi:C-5 cytosine-specific DNA methylase [Sinorhizobium meliloti]|uniref:DNA cytosine methyltransferase n=1 Tax=Rhizobium meliloti TaxID=382 RepID=UPI000FDA0F94|nr:DNA cytosine methyltransferase [Sinorhizobium meliloti]MDX0289475.1 C-5 cytosine-specific DNA methylase [Sinorhizobium meliloti]RVG15017.1 C-5 cytosine-specific DNA methylase [Sinorhizobium meliloti]RVL94686.1 C-5 cytosine-specific DNA methylase [Sinorhizobium meliloti]RVN08687.1 C-5 cytosine-specific DNA methylase [Sinorhizobium meliloti]WGI73014.1 DNA cytosine methyltransferase [Sinorhizobium meliloti]
MFRTDLFSETSTGALMASAYVGAPLIVDSFAGGGGASTGIEMALGRSPDIAINHNPDALALHGANHPETHHLSENVYRVDPLDHLKGKHIGLAWFSPDCKHFSKAKGGKPVERNIRDLCWIIPGWIERIQKSGGRVDVVIMENVEEFKDYGPLVATDRGLMPDPERRGENFEKWCKKLRRLGGKIEFRELRACDYGAPTIRKRLFVIIRFDGKPIAWPEPTHGKPEDPDVMSGRKLPWRTAAECIDWSLPCPSIFDTSAEIWAKHQLRAVRPLEDATMARVARGMKRYVLDAERPFLVSVAHGDSGGRREYPIDEPHGVVTAGGISHAVVAPSVIRFNTGATGQDMRDPLSTVTANSFIKRPGGAAPLGIIAPVLTAAQQGGSVRSVADPHHTITASSKDQNSVIVPTLVGCGGRAGQSRPRAGDEPVGTITAKADGCVAVAFLAQNNYLEPGHDACEPLSTIVGRGSTQSPIVAFMAQHNGDPRPDGSETARPGRAADEPLATITQSGSQQSLVSAFVARQFGTSTGHAVDDPAATVMADGGGKSQLVMPYLQAYYGTGDGQHETEPMRTVTTKDRHGHVEATISVPPFTDAQADRARQVASFMRAHGFWDDREFVTVEISGETFVIVDIGMRMLTPRELFNAQGFPSDYVIDGAWNYQADGAGPVWREFSKSVQVSCVGNSVSPPVACALVSANCSHLAVQRAAA